MIRLTILTLVMSLANIFFTAAQQKWTLEECIDYALENNITLKRRELQVKQGEYSYRQSKLNVLPGLNAGASHTYSRGRSLDELTYEYIDIPYESGRLSMSAGVNLFDGLYNHHNIRQERYNLQAGLYEVEGARDEISLNIVAAYLQILFEKEMREIDEQQLRHSELQLENARVNYELGNIPRSRLYELESQNAAYQHRVTLSQNRVKSAYLELKHLLQLDMEVDFRIEVPGMLDKADKSILMYHVDTIYSAAEENAPGVKRTEYILKSAEKELDITRSQLFPSLSLSAGISSFYSELARNPREEDLTAAYPYDLQIRDNYGQYLNFSISIPIFNRWQTRTRISRAKTNILDTEYMVEEVKQNLYSQVHQHYNDALAARDNFESASKSKIYAEEAFNYAKRQFELGLINFVDYQYAQNNFITAESELLRARYDMMFRLVFLNYYMGNPVSLD